VQRSGRRRGSLAGAVDAYGAAEDSG
jgi:hypothetical protein